MTTRELLVEREKELACIHAICLLAAEAPEPGEAAAGIARALRSATRHPGAVSCAVEFSSADGGASFSALEGVSSGGLPRGEVLESRLPDDPSLGWTGGIRLEYAEAGLGFLPQERTLLDSVLVVAASMLRTANLIARLRAASKGLESKNAALREILAMLEEERRAVAASFRRRLSAELLPLAERARDATLSGARRSEYLELLVDELGRDPDASGGEADPALSPREREVAVQVRNGRTSKEIAALLGIAEATVERHRHNIRRKLRVKERGANLASLLAYGSDLDM
ncbi:MAG: hypothetical protein JXA15_02060 [Spirochaetales bacterium]|nr:hypothetical protein [Spirochaetales bacterium]